MTEETKPVEREAAVALSVAYNAGWDAALERAAQIAEKKYCASGMCDCGERIAAEIETLKGSR